MFAGTEFPGSVWLLGVVATLTYCLELLTTPLLRTEFELLLKEQLSKASEESCYYF